MNQPHVRRLGQLRNGGVPCDLWSLPKCQAKAKSTGKRCGNIAMSEKRVCYLHGGRSGSPSGERNGSYRHGRYTKAGRADTLYIRFLKAEITGNRESFLARLNEDDAKMLLWHIRKQKSKIRRKPEPITYWAAYEAPHGPVWGIGYSKEYALIDGECYIENQDINLAVLPCSENLYEKVWAEGGDLKCRTVKGQLRFCPI